MSGCSSPIYAVDFGVRPETGKKIMKIKIGSNLRDLEQRYGAERIVVLPCGKCPACRKAKRQEWAVRCELESASYENSSFITLTYDQEHCPDKLVKRDLQQFIKAMRNKKIKFRYFGCGEYGSSSARPHFHLIMFGYFPEDAKPYAKSKSADIMFASNLVSDVWNKGLVTVQKFEGPMAAYVAGYVSKKLLDDSDWLEGADPFLCMSRRPGIGRDFLESNWTKLMSYNGVQLKNGFTYHLPRYFKKILEEKGCYLDDIKTDSIYVCKLNDNQEMNDLGCYSREDLYHFRGMRDKLYKNERKRL